MMPISYSEQERVFRLDTHHTTYLCGLVGHENFLGHIYYGPSVPGENLRCLLRLEERPFTPDENPRERASFYDCFPFEYPTCIKSLRIPSTHKTARFAVKRVTVRKD